MAKPFRNVRSASSATYARTFFVTTKTSMGRALLQSDRNAMLLVDVLRTCIAAGRFQVRDFVIMPNHVHLLITVQGDTPIEKAMQFIKGGFSFRLKKETGYAGEVWQEVTPRCERTVTPTSRAIGTISRETPFALDWPLPPIHFAGVLSF